MNCEELQINDWVEYNGLNQKVKEISGLDNEVYLTIDECIDCTQVNPILITAEILEKNGFVYNAIPFADGWEQFGLTLYRGGNGYRIDCGINVSLIIDCVHQLQHALRLCGIEHEITL